jgi:hypothetical protein
MFIKKFPNRINFINCGYTILDTTLTNNPNFNKVDKKYMQI